MGRLGHCTQQRGRGDPRLAIGGSGTSFVLFQCQMIHKVGICVFPIRWGANSKVVFWYFKNK